MTIQRHQDGHGLWCRSADVDKLEADVARLKNIETAARDLMDWLDYEEAKNQEGECAAKLDAALALARGEA